MTFGPDAPRTRPNLAEYVGLGNFRRNFYSSDIDASGSAALIAPPNCPTWPTGCVDSAVSNQSWHPETLEHPGSWSAPPTHRYGGEAIPPLLRLLHRLRSILRAPLPAHAVAIRETKLIDYDGDGWLDLSFTQNHAGSGHNMIYRNTGDGHATFERVTHGLGEIDTSAVPGTFISWAGEFLFWRHLSLRCLPKLEPQPKGHSHVTVRARGVAQTLTETAISTCS